MPSEYDKSYRMTIVVNVDTVALAEHDGDGAPPPNDMADWYGGDLERAIEMGVAEIEHAEIENIEEVVTDGDGA